MPLRARVVSPFRLSAEVASCSLVLASSTFATYCWRRIGMRGPTLHYSHVLWLSLLTALITA